MPAEAIMALANSTQANYSTNNTHQQHHHQSAVFEDSPPSMSNGVDFFESLAAEKPTHLEYLKNFRVYQCPQFLQHKCTQHRPFTCFNWHFQNQRRRQPVQRGDKSFNYSPDIYCNQYDETTGTCKKGDECPFLHRVTGDTERRYHLRYYKTSACIHETDDNRNCEKNGPHCAFGHGHDDLRAPIFDASLATGEHGEREIMERLPSTSEDKWNDAEFVLNYYKTESCKKQPRFCRQGYACPHYHNAKDRRRNPKKFKYRSTPCPIVKKVGEDWQDPQKCDKGDNCAMCHTRTEQQFHPDIYKSTKCHDMQQTTYCPRGPFCAFAHVEQHDNDQPEGSIRNRAGTADACFKMARERRRQQLEARQNRNSVSGGESTIRRRAESFTGPSRHFSETYNRTPWSTNAGDGQQQQPQQQQQSAQQRWASNQSPIVMPQLNSSAFDSPTHQQRPEKKEKDLSDQFSKGLNIRQTQWPPHPDREEEQQQQQQHHHHQQAAEVTTSNNSPWSPGNNGNDIFADTDDTDFHLQPTDESDNKVNFADEIRRRRTQSASHSNYSPYDKAQYSPPLGGAAGDQYRGGSEWLSPQPTLRGKSSPISIVQSAAREISAQGSWPKDGSFGSAILRGVGFDSVGNGGSGSGPNSWTDDGRNNEIVALRKQVQDERRNQINMKHQFEYDTQQLREQIRELQAREHQYRRQIEEHNSSSAQVRLDVARERIMQEVRASEKARRPCPVPREQLAQMQQQFRLDLDMLERASAAGVGGGVTSATQ